jgi:pimeloyl-ACP methyl ester carboxylesterase
MLKARHAANARHSRVYSLNLPKRAESIDVRFWIAPGTPAADAGRVFVIVHGIGLSHRPYGRLARELAPSGTVVGVDLPGFGGLRRPTHPMSVPEYAEVVARLLTLMGFDRYEAIGHSMGAQIALELVLADSARARALILIGPVVDPESRTVFQQAIGLARDSVLEPPTTNLMVLRDYLTCGMRWYLAESRAMLLYRTDERIDQLAVPLLVIRGERDPIASEGWSAWLASQPKSGIAVSVAGHRHVVAHTAPKKVAALIATFAGPER